MAHSRLSRPIARLKNTLVALLFVGTQLVAPLAGAGIFAGQAAAAATTNCVTDTAGPNDVPGQKDLTKLCVDYSGSPTSIETTWNWDDTGTSGAGNTLDACNLFDTNGNGNADTAVCVTTTGDPATMQSTTTYTCGDSRADRCTNSVLISTITTGTNFCNVSQQNTNPFVAGNTDTQGDCTVPLASVGGAAAKLIDVCSYPSSQPNSDPSDCVVSQPKAGKLEVVKHLVPTTDNGLFNLQIDGTTKAANVSNNGTTGVVVLPTSNHDVAETAGTSTALTNYDSTISCRDLDGTGTVVASGSGTSLASVPLAEGSDVVCVITNTLKQATLILQKTVVNDNGGTLQQSDFPVAISGTTASWGSNTISPGTYTVSETQQTGYQAGSWGGDCSAAGSVTIAPGQTKTCSITNNDIPPQLTVIKHVVNDNGGTATASSFTMSVTGTNVSSASFAGAENPGTTVTLNAGSFSVGEGTHTGYTQTASSDCSGTIAIGEHKTCTITNDDIAPLLTLVKHVTNDNGGTAMPTDWTLSATPGSGTTLSGSGGFNSQTAQANKAYTLSEAGPSGYSASSWSCNGGVLANNNSLTLNIGDNVTCDITNNDIAPQLTVTKVVTNDDGGTLSVSNFPLFVNSVQVTSGATNIFNAGSYTVSETQQPGYSLDSITGDCLSNGSITLVIGGVYSCTLTNNDIPATVTVTKTVINDNGGNASTSDFKLLVGSTPVTSGVSNTFAANQSYTVSEQALVDGYAQTSLSCEDSTTHTALGATFTPTNGEHISCSIVNNDIAPQLTIIKHVVNDNNGSAQASDFTMSVTGTNVSNTSFAGAENPGTTVTLNAGSYGVDEGAHSGYTKTLGANCSGTIAIGEAKTCVITNDDQQAKLTLIKHIINDNGGNETASDFQAYIDSTAVSWSSATSLNAGSYTASEHELPGWTASAWSGDCAADGTITLTSGEDKTCEITNNDVPPSLTIVKNVTNDNGGNVLASAFKVRVNGTLLTGAVTSNSDQTATYQYASPLANTSYSIGEDSTAGYSQTSLTCTDDDTHASVAQPVMLNEGQHVTCVITNDDQAPHLSLQKYVTNSHGGTAQATDWTLSATPADNNFATITGSGSASGSAQANEVYTLAESNGPDGYADSGWNCDAGDLSGNLLTLSPGVSASCSITNSDIAPTLTLVKHVTNDNGGSKTADQWTLTAQHGSDAPVINHQGNASNNGTVATTSQTTVKANTTYDLNEDGPDGYDASNWSCDGGSLDGSTLVLALATNVTCTVTNNDQPASVTLIKEIVNDDTNQVQPDDFHLTIDGNLVLSGHSYDVTSNQEHTIGEGKHDNYKFVQVVGQTEADDAACRAANASMLLLGTGTLPQLSEGQHVTCVITNTKLTTIRINKITQFADGTTTNDPQDFHFTTDGEGLSDFSLDTDNGDSTLSDNQVFNNLTPDQNEDGYHISEVPVDGWQLNHISCGDTEVQTTDNGVFIFPSLGEDVVCNFVNTKQPVVNITKTNNRPQPTVVNDTVTYTMTVSVPTANQPGGAPIYNTVVTDLPPSGFTYVPGSWTATSNMPDHNVAADVVAGSPTGQPTYGSPGLWHLGSLMPGEVITLTYNAKIGSNVSDGTYHDLAFVKGNPSPLSSTEILGNLSIANTPFVATSVSVLSPPLVPKVLGAEILINTGTNIVAAQYVLPILLIAGVSVTRRTTHYKEKAGK